MVDNGVYALRIELTPGVALIAKNRFGATLDGGGRGIVVMLGSDNLIEGFEIRNGTIGIYSSGASNTIRACRIVCNWQTGILAVRSLPHIEENLIAFNRASGIQCWDVQARDSAVIGHNTIAFNRAHGVSLGGRCRVQLQNNVIAFNARLGLKVAAQAEQAVLVENNFYSNRGQVGGVVDGNFSFDPLFMAPRMHYDFSSDPKALCTIRGSDKRLLGAQFH
jgi:nitrous oxidase accessory protein NosD